MRMLIVVFGLLAAGGGAYAQSPSISDFDLTGTLQSTGVQLTVHLNTSTIPAGTLLDNATGFDIYRREGASCTDDVLVTAMPIPWVRTWDRTVTFLDTGARADRMYTYTVRIVDANRTTVPVVYGWDYPLDGIVKTGDVPIGRGRLEVSWGDAQVFRCSSDCRYGGAMTVAPGVVIPPSESGTYDVYADLVGRHPQFGFYLRITRAEPATCNVLPVAERAWGDVKSLFK